MYLPPKELLTNSTTPKVSRKAPLKPLLVLWPLENPTLSALAAFSPCSVAIPSNYSHECESYDAIAPNTALQ